MSWRNVIISRRCKLDYKMGYLVVRGEETQRIYLDEVAILMLENPAVSLTGCLMEALMEKKIRVIFCDEKRLPVSEVVPYHGSHGSSLKVRQQSAWTKEAKARIWQAIITEKITQQAGFLRELGREREFALLDDYRQHVELGDATNREGHAAKVYFNSLFGKDFTRGLDCPVNAALNYGYSILLSHFSREIAMNGYLTQIGVFHNNMFNHFNLSSDLMEPFRILIDRAVYEMHPAQFMKEERYRLGQVFSQTVRCSGSKQLVPAAIQLYVRSALESVTSGNAEGIRFYQKV